jgi:3-oxoacyl-[acyl-carrier-protein] synthase II
VNAAGGVAITGVGILTPLGDALGAVGDALAAGRRSIAPALDVPEVGESRFAEFEATKYANVRGMRLYNRTTRLGICATKLALVDAGLDGVTLPGAGLGLVLASTYAHLDTAIEYDRSLVTAGIQQTNPALMPLAIPSAPGATLALAFGAKAFSITLANEAAAGLDALGLGMRLVQGGRAAACVVVGAFAACKELSQSSARAGQLVPAEELRVFDARHRGRVLGEASAAFVLERLETARARGAAPKGILRGHGAAFAPVRAATDAALRRACQTALGSASLAPADVAYVSAGANGQPEPDDAEARALLALLGPGAAAPVAAVKSSLGDMVDAAGLVQAALALDGLGRGRAPAVAGLERPAQPGLRYATGATAVSGEIALVTATSDLGACSAIVLQK